ncbi:MAG: hypothetical protein NT091_03850, partial [Candidatus Falkowbacteria bacterium]|nr:hypothetical protein [Candidatus Falkowbacteria bacterium]
NQLKDRLDDITREAFKEQRPLTTEEITQIKNELKNIKGLVINFDETITIEKTFADFLKSFTEDDLLCRFFKEFYRR